MLSSHFNPGDGGLVEGTAKAEGPPAHNFAQNQFFGTKFGMLIPQGISNYVKFVSYPTQGGLRNMPSTKCILLNLSKFYFKYSVFP